MKHTAGEIRPRGVLHSLFDKPAAGIMASGEYNRVSCPFRPMQ